MALYFPTTSDHLSAPWVGAQLTLPFTIGMWIKNDVVNGTTRFPFAIDGVNSSNYITLFHDTNPGGGNFRLVMRQREGGSNADASITFAVSAFQSKWYFIAMRFISTTRRTMDFCSEHLGDSPGAATNTTSRNLPTQSNLRIGWSSVGGAQNDNGYVSDFWIYNDRIWPEDAGAMPREMTWLMARRGPFANPYVQRSKMVFMAPFRNGWVLPGGSRTDQLIQSGYDNNFVFSPEGSPRMVAPNSPMFDAPDPIRAHNTPILV